MRFTDAKHAGCRDKIPVLGRSVVDDHRPVHRRVLLCIILHQRDRHSYQGNICGTSANAALNAIPDHHYLFHQATENSG